MQLLPPFRRSGGRSSGATGPRAPPMPVVTPPLRCAPAVEPVVPACSPPVSASSDHDSPTGSLVAPPASPGSSAHRRADPPVVSAPLVAPDSSVALEASDHDSPTGSVVASVVPVALPARPSTPSYPRCRVAGHHPRRRLVAAQPGVGAEPGDARRRARRVRGRPARPRPAPDAPVLPAARRRPGCRSAPPSRLLAAHRRCRCRTRRTAPPTGSRPRSARSSPCPPVGPTASSVGSPLCPTPRVVTPVVRSAPARLGGDGPDVCRPSGRRRSAPSTSPAAAAADPRRAAAPPACTSPSSTRPAPPAGRRPGLLDELLEPVEIGHGLPVDHVEDVADLLDDALGLVVQRQPHLRPVRPDRREEHGAGVRRPAGRRPGDLLVGQLLEDRGVPLPPHPGDLRDPVGHRLPDLPDLLTPRT